MIFFQFWCPSLLLVEVPTTSSYSNFEILQSALSMLYAVFYSLSCSLHSPTDSSSYLLSFVISFSIYLNTIMSSPAFHLGYLFIV